MRKNLESSLILGRLSELSQTFRDPLVKKISIPNAAILGLANITLSQLPESTPLRLIQDFIYSLFIADFGLTATIFKQAYFNPLFYKHPDLIYNKLNKDTSAKILKNPINTVLPPFQKNGELRSYPYSMKVYLKIILKKIAKEINTYSDFEEFIGILMSTPHLELKRQGIFMLKKTKKGYISEYIAKHSKNSLTDFENLLVDYIQLNKGEGRKKLISKIELFKEKSIFTTADKVSQKVKVILEKERLYASTLEPYIRLFILRRIKEILVSNQIPTEDDIANITSIQLKNQLKKYKIAITESGQDLDSPTLGLEIQPTHSYKQIFLKTTYDEIQKLIKYGKLKSQNDVPFEIVLPPTKSYMAQLLMLREIIIQTGLPPSNLGLQLNFGGFGRERTIPLALQRMILIIGQLNTNSSEIEKSGAFWDAGALLNAATKGEISLRSTSNPLSASDIVSLYSANNHPEFFVVSELRASLGSVNFETLCRGIITAYRMARLAKAKENTLRNKSFTQDELKSSFLWDKITKDFNDLFQKYGIGNIFDEWSSDDWKKLGTLICLDEHNHKLSLLLQSEVKKILLNIIN